MRTILHIAAITIAFCGWAAAPAQAPRQSGEYPLTADSLVQPGIAHGTLEGPFEFRSREFAGTVRRYWVYVPAGYDPARPPNLLVFQDGQRATNPSGSLRVPNVLDNLIARGDIPPTLGLFVTSGTDDFIIHVAVADNDSLYAFVIDRLTQRREIADVRTSVVYEHIRRDAAIG